MPKTSISRFVSSFRSRPIAFKVGLVVLAGCELAILAPLCLAGRQQTVHGKDAMSDWSTDAPGVRRRITVADLPQPYATRGVDNGPRIVRRPEGAWPKAPAGFKVTQYITDLYNPREIVTAPNGDLFIAESEPGRMLSLRLPADARRVRKKQISLAIIFRLPGTPTRR